VVEATDLRLFHDPPLARWLHLARPRSVAVEGLVRPRCVMICEVLTLNSLQVSFAPHEDFVEALSPDRADQALYERVLPRRVRCGDNLFNPHAVNPIREAAAIDPVPVTEQVPGRRVIWKRFHDLLGCPAFRRMTCDVEVNDGPSMVPENHKADEDTDLRVGLGPAAPPP
jgi:hypothetical protein